MRVIYRKIRHARYLYIKRNVEKLWGSRYTLGARYLSKNTVFHVQPEDDHYQAPKHVAVPYVENTLYSTNKYSCVRPVHKLYISYSIFIRLLEGAYRFCTDSC